VYTIKIDTWLILSIAMGKFWTVTFAALYALPVLTVAAVTIGAILAPTSPEGAQKYLGFIPFSAVNPSAAVLVKAYHRVPGRRSAEAELRAGTATQLLAERAADRCTIGDHTCSPFANFAQAVGGQQQSFDYQLAVLDFSERRDRRVA